MTIICKFLQSKALGEKRLSERSRVFTVYYVKGCKTLTNPTQHFSVALNTHIFRQKAVGFLFLCKQDNLIMKTCLFIYFENFTTINENFQMKNSGSFHISAQNIDCEHLLKPPRRDGSNKYPQSIFLSRNKKINVYPCKSQYCMKVRLKGVKTI